jgi:hypothetical protein
MKPKGLNETQFLDLLDKALAKVAPDAKLRSAIFEEVTKEIRLYNHLASFTKFCEEGSVPDLKPETVSEMEKEIASGFGEGAKVSVTPDEKNGGALAVEVTLPDERTVSNKLKVLSPEAAAQAVQEAEQAKVPFVPFPVTLPADAELVWVLARRENLGPDEAARALASIEEEFWATKSGQKLLRENTERNFAEFIANVPSAALLASGLKRHYKEPETLQTLRVLTRTEKEEFAPKMSVGKPAQKAADNSGFPPEIGHDEDADDDKPPFDL